MLRFVRNFIIYLLRGLQIQLRKRKFAKPTNLHSSLVLSNVAITFLGCLECHSLNLNNSDLGENPLTFQVNSRTTKSAAMGLCAFLGRLSDFSGTEMRGKLKQRKAARCADTLQAACVNLMVIIITTLMGIKPYNQFIPHRKHCVP